MRAGSARCGGGDGWRTGIPWRGQKQSGGFRFCTGWSGSTCLKGLGCLMGVGGGDHYVAGFFRERVVRTRQSMEADVDGGFVTRHWGKGWPPVG